MGRPHRAAAGGYVYHVLNRANARTQIFADEGDYWAFEMILAEAVQRTHTRLLAYCLMPNHWHLTVWPREDGELSQFVGWLSLTHAQRWRSFRNSRGEGHLYQGRFKSFPVQEDEYFYAVMRYVERNALRAGLVDRAEDWRWSSLNRRIAAPRTECSHLAEWPLPRPRDWLDFVNRPQTDAEVAAIKRSVRRGSPLGNKHWTEGTAADLGLENTLRPPGRPKKSTP